MSKKSQRSSHSRILPERSLPTVSVRTDRQMAVRQHHAWLFASALTFPPPALQPGELVDVTTTNGLFLARGYANLHSAIAVRLLTWEPEPIDSKFFSRRFQQALSLRETLFAHHTTGFRLANGEGDFLPGLVIDYYAGVLVVQIYTAGMQRLLEQFLPALRALPRVRGILLRNDVALRKTEGLPLEEPLLLSGEVPKEVEIKENGIRFAVNIWKGQKTGFFLDQRDKRLALQHYTPGKNVLNCFSYTGGFSVYAALSSSTTVVTSVDYAQLILEEARRNFQINGLEPKQHRFITADVFDFLREAHDQGDTFDVVILDPPAFAKNQAAKERSLQSYRKLNSLGMGVLPRGGILVTCSCSGCVSLEDFVAVLKQAAVASGRLVQVVETFTSGLDHPGNLAMPENSYLKVLFCRIL